MEERAAAAGLPLPELRWLASQMAGALGTLHMMRVLHRDVKPHNILLRTDGYYSLTDFGLAAALDTGHKNYVIGM